MILSKYAEDHFKVIFEKNNLKITKNQFKVNLNDQG